MNNFFTQHPTKIGETYWQHFKFAACFGFKLLWAGSACLLHAIFPFMCQNTGSNVLLQTTQDFIERMPRKDQRLIDWFQAIQHSLQSK